MPDTAAERAGEQAAKATEQVVEATTEGAEAAVAAAAARADEAEATARRMADAAVQGALGQRIDQLTSEVGQCRENLSRVQTELNQHITNQDTHHTTAELQALSTQPISPQAAPLIPPRSTVHRTASETVEPENLEEENGGEEDLQNQPAPSKRRRRMT